ncbi:MAG: Ig-like domain-containing protein [Verrucomicrobia bacterium]|nr:Ig-like domain-containing protein [Verrucomicrobiota bacterium]MDI9380675.1 Ig-like domain-containing protein [Verrucomicrobiota bacterium]NMD22054.1 hypothetical protein [Verrucomicrobiota bacterium]HOA59999.1 Ig-like domain-containing protein [Verrucomicrobiota bacterium]HOF47560.1 Ig-like domain-containing protein [Verrucomicrobiota bacterium]
MKSRVADGLRRASLAVVVSASLLWMSPAVGGQFKRITIDGDFGDWAGVAPAVVDAEADSGSLDFREVYVANDENYLYIRVKLYTQINYSAFQHHVFIDADANPGTGLSIGGIGSELMIENGGGYQQKNGGWNEGSASNLGWAAAPSGPTTEFEVRISRQVRDAGGELVFASNSILLAVEAEDSNWDTVDMAPDSGGAAYDFAPTPPKATGSTTLVSLDGTVWRYSDDGTDWGTDWLAFDFDDILYGWSSGPGLFGFGVPAGTYPTLATTLASGRNTYYLRVPFTWDYDSLGIALVANLYLSDGAVLYLNGAEVKRVRMPDGEIGYGTPATGGPAAPGQAEFFTVPASGLVTGANVLEAEVHQAAGTPTELAFGLKLEAIDSLPPAIEDPTQPADRTVTEGEATTFGVGIVTGTTPLAYQWFKDDAPIEGATEPTLTIPVVLVTDAGGYRVEITNATGVKAVSRTAQLTTTAVAVSLTNGAEPADRTVLQGESTTFAVEVIGSPVLAYQWFKNQAPIEGATGPEYTIGEAVLGDAGQYHVTVSNRLGAVSSRTARLGVLPDTYPPLVAQLAGSGRKVVAVFSEPVEAASATAPGHYTLSGGASVQAAALDPADRRTVTLTTTALSFGAVYTLEVKGVEDLFGNAADTTAVFRSAILIDGSFEDWAEMQPLATEVQETAEGLEFNEIYVANDEIYLYLRFNFHANVGQLPVDAYFHIFSDTDNDLGTGFVTAGLGSEMMIENGWGYQQKGGQFNEGNVSGLDFVIGPAAASSDFECRISRQATYDSDGQRVYDNETIALALQLISNTWASLDIAPSAGALVYAFAELPAITPGPLHVQMLGSRIEIVWTGPGVLEAKDSLIEGAWAPVPDAASPYSTNATAPQRYYRLRL